MTNLQHTLRQTEDVVPMTKGRGLQGNPAMKKEHREAIAEKSLQKLRDRVRHSLNATVSIKHQCVTMIQVVKIQKKPY